MHSDVMINACLEVDKEKGTTERMKTVSAISEK